RPVEPEAIAFAMEPPQPVAEFLDVRLCARDGGTTSGRQPAPCLRAQLFAAFPPRGRQTGPEPREDLALAGLGQAVAGTDPGPGQHLRRPAQQAFQVQDLPERVATAYRLIVRSATAAGQQPLEFVARKQFVPAQ